MIADNAANERSLGFLPEAVKEWLKGQAFTEIELLCTPSDEYIKVTLYLEQKAIKWAGFSLAEEQYELGEAYSY